MISSPPVATLNFLALVSRQARVVEGERVVVVRGAWGKFCPPQVAEAVEVGSQQHGDSESKNGPPVVGGEGGDGGDAVGGADTPPLGTYPPHRGAWDRRNRQEGPFSSSPRAKTPSWPHPSWTGGKTLPEGVEAPQGVGGMAGWGCVDPCGGDGGGGGAGGDGGAWGSGGEEEEGGGGDGDGEKGMAAGS